MVNIPIAGAVKVEYTVAGGGAYAIFVDTTTPTKWEIGLTTVDGVTATLERVCVTYTEGVPFASVPADATTSTQHQATHYLRALENGAKNWWPIDAAFRFAGETKTVCVVVDGQVQGEAVSGPFPKPQPTPAPTAVAPVTPPPAGSFAVTVTASGTGSGTVAGAGSYASGASVTLTATATAGSVFTQWTSGPCATSTTATCAFTISANVTANAQFDGVPPTNYTVTTTTSGSGTVTGAGSYAAGTSVTLTATATAGSVFTQWTSGPCSGTATTPCTFTINGNVTANAQFTLNQYTITATAGANGTISPSGSVTVNSGGSQAFTITANTGYAIQDVTVDGVSQGAIGTYTFPNVTAPHTITAAFSVLTITPGSCTVTMSTGCQVTFNAAGVGTVGTTSGMLLRVNNLANPIPVTITCGCGFTQTWAAGYQASTPPCGIGLPTTCTW